MHTGSGRKTHALPPDKDININVYIPSNIFSNNFGFQNKISKISMQVDSDLYVVQ